MHFKFTAFATASVLAVNSLTIYAFAEEKTDYTQCSILAEAETGTVLYESNGDVIVPIGMLNKLMTVKLAYDEIESGRLALDNKTATSSNANSKQGAQIWLNAGEGITIEDALKAVIIGNANDAAAVIAEAISETEADFVELMNNKAASLDMKDTIFTNPDGYYESDKQKSTAFDLSKLICELTRKRIFEDYFTLKLDYVRNGEAMLVNSNKLVNKYNGLVGFKACYSKETGYCLAAAAVKDKKTFAVVLLGYDDEDEMYAKARQLLDKGFAEYGIITPELPEDYPTEITVKNGEKNTVGLVYDKVESIVVGVGEAEGIKMSVALPEYLDAPVETGEKLGEVLFYKGDEHIFSVNICAEEEVKKICIKSTIVKMLKLLIDF